MEYGLSQIDLEYFIATSSKLEPNINFTYLLEYGTIIRRASIGGRPVDGTDDEVQAADDGPVVGDVQTTDDGEKVGAGLEYKS